MIDYIIQNQKVYDKKFNEGWGSYYPDSNIITFFHRYIKDRIPENKVCRVLDFGCGRGANLEFLVDMGFEVYGIDISTEAIEICRKNERFKGSNFIQADIINDKTLAESFDVKFDIIIATASLTYLKRDDIKEVIRQFKEVLTDEGLIMATFFEKQSAYSQQKDENGMVCTTRINLDIEHYTFILENREELRSLFKDYNEMVVGDTQITFPDFEAKTTYYIGQV